MRGDKKELGKVDAVDLFIEDHGLLTLSVSLDFGGRFQSFGGFCLDTYNEKTEKREGSAAGTDFILSILHLFGVTRLSEAVGKPVYALREGDGTLITGLETPEFDGGRIFKAVDWQNKWFPNRDVEDD